VLRSAGAGNAMAQASGVVAPPSGINTRVANAMQGAVGSYEPAQCDALDDDLHFKVSSGKVYLKTSIETDVEGNRRRALDNGERGILESSTEDRQGKGPGAWYSLRRI